MGERLIESVVTILLAIVSVAVIATLVSRNANTAGIISAGGGAFTESLQAAEEPVSGVSSIEAPGIGQFY